MVCLAGTLAAGAVAGGEVDPDVADAVGGEAVGVETVGGDADGNVTRSPPPQPATARTTTSVKGARLFM